MKMFLRKHFLIRIKYLLIIVAGIIICDYFGVFKHALEDDFNTNFKYPLDNPNIEVYANQSRHGKIPEVPPINSYNYTFLSNCKHKCMEDDGRLGKPRLVFIIKSKMDNFDRRNTIRQSWGYEKRFSDVSIRTVFVLGVASHNQNEIQKLIAIEQENYQDIVQAEFIDTYFNNTIKIMMGFKWATQFCPQSKFYMFVDDDYYVSTKNVLRFTRNPVNYPEYLIEADEALQKLARRLSQTDFLTENITQNDHVDVNEIKNLVEKHSVHTIENKQHLNVIKKYLSKVKSKDMGKNRNAEQVNLRKLLDMELPDDVKLFSGYVFSSSPLRHKASKWYVSLEEYPWDKWPTYVTAGAFILSQEALFKMYFISMYTKHFRYVNIALKRNVKKRSTLNFYFMFRFDDIYLGIVALKANIEPLHSEEFYFQKAVYAGTQSYRYVIASHGYDDPVEMVKIWTKLKAAGHA